MVANRQGGIVRWDISQGNAHDLAPVKGGILDGLSGVCFADSGYVSSQIRQDLTGQDLAFIAKPTKAMEDELWWFNQIWAKKYRQRQVVEGVFSRLKERLGLVAPRWLCIAWDCDPYPIFGWSSRVTVISQLFERLELIKRERLGKSKTRYGGLTWRAIFSGGFKIVRRKGSTGETHAVKINKERAKSLAEGAQAMRTRRV